MAVTKLAPKPIPVATLGVSTWARFSLPQGVVWDGAHYYVSQAWTTDVDPIQDTVIHRYDATGVYRDCMVLPRAGHCSAFGYQKLDSLCTNIYVRWDQFDPKLGLTGKAKLKSTPVVQVLYRPGIVNFGDLDTVTVDGLKGQPVLSPTGARIATRTISALGIETYTVRDKGETVPLAVFKVATGGTFQGYAIRNNDLYRQYGKTGKPSKIIHHDWRTGKVIRTIDTSTAAPTGEPEGLFFSEGILHFMKRVGGANASRKLHIFKVDA